MSKKTFNNKVDELFDDLVLPGDTDIKQETSQLNRTTAIKAKWDKITDEERQSRGEQISKAKRGKESNHKGKTRPWKGKPSHFAGQTHTIETRNKISKTKLSTSDVDKQEISKKISASKKGQESWNKGIAMSDETKQKQSLAKKGKPGKSIKPVLTELGIFASVKEAIEFHTLAGISNAVKKLAKNLKEKTNGCKYLSKEEYIMLTGKEI